MGTFLRPYNRKCQQNQPIEEFERKNLRLNRRRRSGTRGADRKLRRSFGGLRPRRTRRPGSGLRRDHSQEPGVGVSGGHHPGHDPALSHVAAQPALHRRHARQAPCRSCRPEKGGRHRGQKRVGSSTLVEARPMALVWRTSMTVDLILTETRARYRSRTSILSVAIATNRPM